MLGNTELNTIGAVILSEMSPNENSSAVMLQTELALSLHARAEFVAGAYFLS